MPYGCIIYIPQIPRGSSVLFLMVFRDCDIYMRGVFALLVSTYMVMRRPRCVKRAYCNASRFFFVSVWKQTITKHIIMKKLFYIFTFLLCLSATSCYDSDIDGIKERLDAIENNQIASLKEQIKAINNTLPELENTGKELKEYITKLQSAADKLQEEINAIDKEMEAVEESLGQEMKDALEDVINNAAAANDSLRTEILGDIEKSQSDILSQLETAKSKLSDELAQIKSTIETLQAKDKALEEEIANLKEYVNGEIQNTADWAAATFATLEQYDSLATEIAVINENIEALNNSITLLEAYILETLEKRISETVTSLVGTVNKRITATIEPLKEEILEEAVASITSSYKKAISTAKNDITAAYTQAIADAISSVETSMRSWVNEQLAGYYTIAEVEAKLAILSDACAIKENLQQEIANMAASLESLKNEMSETYNNVITEAITTNNGVIEGKIADAVSSINNNIDAKIESVNTKITAIEERLKKVEEDIATISQQVENINATIEDLRIADTELDGYIKNLQTIAGNLQKAIEDTDKKIGEVETALQGEVSAAKTELLAELASLKSELEGELAQITSTIATLQEKDKELENRITVLQQYLQNELASNRDWANATFATLVQYNALAEEVAAIKVQIQALNEGILQLESRINTKIATDIAQAVTAMNTSIQQKVTEITNAYTAAIRNAKDEITTAYETAIELAVFNLELSMQSWVNDKLGSYYTIAQIDAMLSTLETNFTTRLEAQKSYLLGLINSLSADLNSKISNNKSLIDALRADVTTLFGKDSEQAVLIAGNATAIAKNANEIKANAAAITANSGSIAENNTKIAGNSRLIEANAALIAGNKQAVEALSSSVDQKVQELLDEITRNAADIANNASLIAKNATAISNNAAAIAQNAADIQQLQNDLATTKEEITEAYQEAINNAIESLNGALRDEIGKQVEAINARIESEIATVNTAVAALDTRITALEKEVKNIKVAIYSIQGEIEEIHEQIAALIERIQSLSFVPEYSDGKATMYYTNSSGNITAGSATLRYEIRPAAVAEELLEVWEEALSVKAVYTQTRAAGDFVSLNVESATAEDGILSVVISGSNLSEAFFRSEIQANIRLEISNGYNCLTSGYTHMIPWTTNVVYIPDNNFKAYLLGEFDDNGDGEISLDEAETITDINISATLLQVKSMAGIEYFTNLEKLDCSYNRVTTLDLANNSKLTSVNVSNNKLTSLALPASAVTVDASKNQLTTLDVSVAAGLTSLNVADNKLASLNVGQNKQLKSLGCNNNELASLDVTKLLSLTALSCGGNNIATLNLTKNTQLAALDCHDNSLALLDLTKNSELESLDCSKNSLSAMYIGSNKLKSLACANNQLTGLNVALQTKLESLDCAHNSLTQLDITKCTKLKSLDCSYNALASLNISCNTALTALDCSGNNNLAKLWVKDDSQVNNIAITKEDATIIHHNNGGLDIPDAVLKAYLVNNYDDDGDGEISIAESDNITMVNCSGKGVSDLTGLEACTNLVTLNCANNNITTIELPNLVHMSTLTCYGNPIERINLDNCTSLNQFNIINSTTNAVDGNAIKINGYTGAATMDFTIAGTSFTTFTFINATALTEIKFYGEFETVNLYGNSVLERIDVNPILDLQNLDIHSCKLQTLDVTEKSKLKWLDASNNELTEMNVTQNNMLEHLNLANNQLSVINVRNNTALTYFNINNNSAINTVNVKNNTALKSLYAEGLSIVDINLSNNNAMTDANLRNNALLETLVVWDACVTTRNDYLHFDMGNKYVQDAAGNHYGYPFSVGQYIPWFNGGVIYETSNSGKNGKIISVSETSTEWGLYGTITAATNDSDGWKNVQTMKGKGYYNSSPAYVWCGNYGKDDWYLPAKNELQVIYNNKSNINATLSGKGYTTLGTGVYWSSTEDYNYGYVYSIDFSNGYTYYNHKDYTNNVRSILAF